MDGTHNGENTKFYFAVDNPESISGCLKSNVLIAVLATLHALSLYMLCLQSIRAMRTLWAS